MVREKIVQSMLDELDEVVEEINVRRRSQSVEQGVSGSFRVQEQDILLPSGEGRFIPRELR